MTFDTTMIASVVGGFVAICTSLITIIATRSKIKNETIQQIELEEQKERSELRKELWAELRNLRNECSDLRERLREAERKAAKAELDKEELMVELAKKKVINRRKDNME